MPKFRVPVSELWSAVVIVDAVDKAEAARKVKHNEVEWPRAGDFSPVTDSHRVEEPFIEEVDPDTDLGPERCELRLEDCEEAVRNEVRERRDQLSSVDAKERARILDTEIPGRFTPSNITSLARIAGEIIKGGKPDNFPDVSTLTDRTEDDPMYSVLRLYVEQHLADVARDEYVLTPVPALKD